MLAMRKLLALMLVLCVLPGCAGAAAEEAAAAEGNPVVRIEIDGWGTVYAELYPEIAPISVANFLALADRDFYRGTTFHRIISGFMMQGGGFTEDGLPKPADNIKGEFAKNGVTNNIDHDRGVISMARANDFNSASSQFFIMHKKADHLDGQYAAFGHVTEGMDIVDQICENTPVQNKNGSVALADRPVIETIRVID